MLETQSTLPAIPKKTNHGNKRVIRRCSGFSMIELMITIVITGILLKLAVPAFQSTIQVQRIKVEANNLLNDLQFARSEAEKEGQPVTICVSSDGATCAAAGTGWQSGWIVFSDQAGNQIMNSGTDVLLRVQQAWTSSDTMTTSPSVTAITYNRDGFATSIALTGQLFILHTTPGNTGATRCVWIDTLGRQQIQTAGQALATNQVTACS